ncbi:MAG: hypothetical protein F6J93_25420 [Oscillatoria sp. SIO1A7]|nr:hypothetical protein [Oscillatoria sp. SIO1A7]
MKAKERLEAGTLFLRKSPTTSLGTRIQQYALLGDRQVLTAKAFQTILIGY